MNIFDFASRATPLHSVPASNAVKSNMAANAEFQDLAASQGNNKQKVPKFEVKFVGGPRYDLSNLPKTKSGNRRRSFRRRKIPQQLEGIGLLLEYHSLTL